MRGGGDRRLCKLEASRLAPRLAQLIGVNKQRGAAGFCPGAKMPMRVKVEAGGRGLVEVEVVEGRSQFVCLSSVEVVVGLQGLGITLKRTWYNHS